VAKAVTVTGTGLSGADAGNYTVANPTGLTADITAATLARVDGITALDKVADGTPSATLNTAGAQFVGRLTGDRLLVAAASGRFADALVGRDKPVAITGITLGGEDSRNYVLAQTSASTTASILTPTTGSGAEVSSVTAPIVAVVTTPRPGAVQTPAAVPLVTAGVPAPPSGSTGVVSLSLVRSVAGTGDQLIARVSADSARADGGFQFEIPANLVDTGRASVTLEGGQSLPSWLSFDADRGLLVAARPLPAGMPLTLMISSPDGRRLRVLVSDAR
jgi:hypothetical protein